MRRPYHKAVLLFMLIVSLMMSVGAYQLNARGLMHDLAHATQTPPAGDHEHELQRTSQNTSTPQPLSDAEHTLFHVLSYCEQLPSLTFTAFNVPPARIIPAMPDLLTLPPAALESPFRPPRRTSLT